MQLLENWTHPRAYNAKQWQNLPHYHKIQNTIRYHVPDLFIHQSFRTVKEQNQLPLMKHVTIIRKVINFFVAHVTEYFRSFNGLTAVKLTIRWRDQDICYFCAYEDTVFLFISDSWYIQLQSTDICLSLFAFLVPTKKFLCLVQARILNSLVQWILIKILHSLLHTSWSNSFVRPEPKTLKEPNFCTLQ